MTGENPRPVTAENVVSVTDENPRPVTAEDVVSAPGPLGPAIGRALGALARVTARVPHERGGHPVTETTSSPVTYRSRPDP